MATDALKKPRGTLDYFYEDADVLEGLRKVLMDEAETYGCRPCDVPLFEESKLFHRTAGESSDIVTKETFDLASKGEKDYTLRPEFTAGVNRAVIENKYYASPDMPLRLSYFGNVFRYERPQAGRLREFHQYGVEFIDSVIDVDSSVDAFLLSIRAAEKALGTPVVAKINFLGSFQSREAYKKELAAYFTPFIGSMCDDCKRRLTTNPLRILDCKDPSDQKIAQGAPKIQNFLTPDDKSEYQKLLAALTASGVSFTVDDDLVRGLDYYTGLVWEINDPSKPNMGAIGGGGKYSALMSEIGGPNFEGIGFSLGVERILLCLSPERKATLKISHPLDVFLIDLAKNGSALLLADQIRSLGKSVTIASFTRGLGGCFKMADRLAAKVVLIADSDGTFKLKDMANRTQETVTMEEALRFFGKGK
jgi:histidyl-tRNA synthetase